MGSPPNIQTTVLNVIEDFKEYGATMKDYRRLENMAVRFYSTKLRGFNMPSLTSVRANIDYSTRIWAFPSDYIRYTKVAYEYGGRLWALTNDDTLAMAETPNICSNPVDWAALPTTSNSGYWLAPFIGSTRTFYASGGGFNANYYRVNHEKGYIQFSEALPAGKAVIEYLSSGEDVNGLTLVPRAYEYAFDRYLKWQYCDLKPSLKGAAAGFKQEYELALWDANILAKAPTIQECLDEIYKGSGIKYR